MENKKNVKNLHINLVIIKVKKLYCTIESAICDLIKIPLRKLVCVALKRKINVTAAWLCTNAGKSYKCWA
jgi:hypothetical protein